MTTEPTPRVLLVTTCRWLATARLGMALAAVGCAVEAVCPRTHPLTRTRAVARVHRYRPLAPLRSVATALEAARPDLVVPCDDLATTHLHRLHARAVPPAGVATRTLLEHSLGDPTSFAVAAGRAALGTFARERGVRTPAGASVRTAGDLRGWLARHGLPAVIKADGTYGGRGVRIVHTEAEAMAAVRALGAPPSPARALKRALVNREGTYVLPCALRRRPALSVQAFVAGRDANSTVVCRDGHVIAAVSALVLERLGERGPASVLRIVEHPEITAAVERIVLDLKLSGVVGFDFLVEPETGAAHLIEMNPRATQVAHLRLGRGRDLPAAVRTMLTGDPVPDRPAAVASEVIVLFPQEWMRDAASPFLAGGHHDVPWTEPGLVRACLEEDARARVWTRLSAALGGARRGAAR